MSSDSPYILPPVGFLAELSEELRARLTAAGQIKELAKGAYLVAQGDTSHDLGVILSGRLVVTVHAHGDIIKLAELGPGETVGEMNIIDPGRASADVVVMEPARVWTITPAAFDKLVAADPMAGYAILKMLAHELCRRLRRNSETMLHQLETTRAHFVELDY